MTRGLPAAIVDFADQASSHACVRRVFDDPVDVLRATTIAEVIPVLDAAERHARAGGWAVGMVTYEAAPAFDAALAVTPPGALPLAWFALFDRARDAGASPDASGHISLAGSSGDIGESDHARRVGRITDYIAAGDVYQVNLTLPFRAATTAAPLALYDGMRAAQRGGYGAYLDLGDAQVMSASPELFFERRGALVTSRPMKGTAPRGLDSADDLARRDALCRSVKERAENVMIVDLVRNDLGRIARIGSVCVPSLFKTERYPGVWQLTSTVQAEVAPELPLAALFRALFPAGSITGAPKVRAMEIIRELERRPREAYCGAIGVIRPGGDATFNVAIRTAWTTDAGRTVHLAAGGAITIDSTAAGEWREVEAKIAAFTTPRATPDLFETLRIESGEARRADRHLARLEASASYFGIPFDAARARALLDDAARRAPPLARARLELRRDGTLHASVQPFRDDASTEPRRVALARTPVPRDDRLLYHKTMDRRRYDEAVAVHPGCFDVLLWNADGEVTEFTRGSVVVELDGALWTPPVECGLLPGVLRGELVDSGAVAERVIGVAELGKATRAWFVNALRGWIPVTLDTMPAAR